jgi:nitrogen fixation/metabolism regulation signal transduction histidine kinase
VLQPHLLLEQLTPLLRQMLPRRIGIHVSSRKDLHAVLANATQLKQIVLNLCINGADAIRDTGSITISAVNTMVTEAVARTIPQGRTGPHVQLSVTDTGSGIPAAILEKIFDPFFTTKDVGKGTGLGLSTVRGIVKGHGGFLHVESTVGVGTTFHIYLPAAAQAPVAAAPTVAADGRGETILVIDEESTVREMLRPFLELHRYRVIVARDDREGIECVRPRRGEIHAVIIELTGNRRAFVTALRTIEPGLPIIAIASAGAGFTAPPPFALVTKPVEPPQILSALQSVIGLKSAP